MAYGKLKDLATRTKSDKFFRDNSFEIASDPKYYGCQGGLASMLYKFIIKKFAESGVATLANKYDVNSVPYYQLENQLYEQIIKKFKRRKVYSSSKDNIWCLDLADMQSLSKYNRGNGYLFSAIHLFCKYAWVVPLKYKTGISIVNAFQNILDSSKVAKQSPKDQNKIKYGLIKAVSFTIIFSKYFGK